MIGWAALGLGIVALAFAGGWLLGRRRALRKSPQRPAVALDGLVSLHESAADLSASLDARTILDRSCAYIHRLLGVRGAMMAVIEEDEDGEPVLRVAAAAGSLTPHADRRIREPHAGLLGQAMGRERMFTIGPSPGGGTELFANVTVPAAVVAPLVSHGETLGAAVVAFDEGVTPRDEQLQLLATVAAHTAIVLENARFLARFREGRNQWESVFNALSDGIALLDDAHRIQRANRALGELTARPAIALVGEHVCDLLFGQDSELHDALVHADPDGRPPGAVGRSDRLGRVFRVTVTAMRGAAAPGGWSVALVEDLTEWQTMEAQLIQNERMVAVGQLVSGVAHELNNPLTSIAGLAEFLLTRQEIDKANREHLAVIQEQAERANRIVGNLLTFARKGPRETGDIDVSDVVHRAAMLMAYEMRLRHIELAEDLNPALPPVSGDQYQLQQVIVNLLTNAVQAVLHTPDTRPRRVTVRTGMEQGMVTMTVTDSGPGISERDLSHIFTPFFTTKDPGRGTGLGLSISFGIVEGHGGRLWVKDTGPKGTTFQMDLPVSSPDRSGAARQQPAPEPSALPVVPAGRRILVIDADNAFQRMIKALFAGEGQAVDVVSTAANVGQRLQRTDYDLIIADPRAAASAGETLGDVLMQRWPHLTDRVIFVTADVRPETIRWLEQSAFRFFRKPFNVREFLRAAASVFGGADVKTDTQADSRTDGQTDSVSD